MRCFCITLLCTGLLRNNDNSNTMTIIIISTYSLYYYTLHLSYIHHSSVSRFELTLFRLRVSPPCSSSSSVLFFLKVFQAYVYICRERKSNTKNVQSKKNKTEPIQYRKERNTVEKK